MHYKRSWLFKLKVDRIVSVTFQTAGLVPRLVPVQFSSGMECIPQLQMTYDRVRALK